MTNNLTITIKQIKLFSLSDEGGVLKHQGITVAAFVTSIAVALSIFIAQLLIFSGLRRRLRTIYEPKTFLVPDSQKVPTSTNYVRWIKTLVVTKIDDIIPSSGLDAYFFLRYILLQVGYWSGMSFTVAPLLIGLNGMYISDAEEAEYGSNGVDRFSWSNLAAHNPDLLIVHCFIALGIFGILCYYIYRELCLFIELRQSYLVSGMNYVTYNTFKSRNSTLETGKTVLITDIPVDFQYKEKLRSVLSKYPGGVKQVWMNRDFSELTKMIAHRDDTLRQLERAELKMIVQAKHPHEGDLPTTDMFIGTSPGMLWKKLMSEDDLPKCKVSKLYKWRHTHQPWIIRHLPFLTVYENAVTYYKDELNLLNEEIAKFQSDAEILCPLINACLVEFHNPLAAQMAKSQGPLVFNSLAPHFVSPCVHLINDTSDIKWENLTVHPARVFICRCIANICICLFIVTWAFPVAFIGFVSQFQYLVQLVPRADWVDSISPQITESISNLIPPVILAALFSWVPMILRRLVEFKKYAVKERVELSVQHYLFLFLFIQTFLVLTISTGITRVLYEAIKYPTTIPRLLALDLPKAANFFTSYVILQGLSMAGGELLRADKVLSHLFGKWFFDMTARDFFERNITNLEGLDYARLFPIIVNIASITLTYSIISPLIILTATLSFIVLYYAFKYRIMFCNLSDIETHGMFYPKALFQLFSGLYCSELCLIGLYIISYEDSGSTPCVVSVVLMIITLILTMMFHYHVEKMFSIHQDYTSIREPPVSESNEHDSALATGANTNTNTNDDMNTGTFSRANIISRYQDIPEAIVANVKLAGHHAPGDEFRHPAVTASVPCLWIPLDDHGLAQDQINEISIAYQNIYAACTPGYFVKDNNCHIVITQTPPDFLEHIKE